MYGSAKPPELMLNHSKKFIGIKRSLSLTSVNLFFFEYKSRFGTTSNFTRGSKSGYGSPEKTVTSWPKSTRALVTYLTYIP